VTVRLLLACVLGFALSSTAIAAHSHKTPKPVIPATRSVPSSIASASANATAPANVTPDAIAPAPAPRLSNFADTVFAGIVGENAPILSIDLATGTTMGGTPLSFEKTTLDQLQQSFGGLIHSQGDASDAVSWLCYTQHAAKKGDTPTTVWFTSTNGAASASPTLSMVVVQHVDASHKSGCATAPKTFTFPSFAIPALGATLDALSAKYGPIKRDRQGNVYFTSTRPLGDGTGKTVYQTLGYVIGRKKDVVSGIALTQVTTN
jgi:hypothetical protein